VMTKLGLTLNEARTSLRDARRERFAFLGYSFGPHYPYNPSARMYLYMSASPSKKSVQRLKTKVRELLVPSNTDPWTEVRDDLNRTLRGWSSYFNLASPVAAFRSVDHYVRERVRGFLARRHKVAGRGTRRFSFAAQFGKPDIGERFMGQLIVSRASIHGFLVLDWWHRRDEALRHLAEWQRAGKLPGF